ncbi:hypothetical protein KK062_27060 [Fulvivirgaceae bacterium PWU5]|uniref:Uncharacterized protein n=1 Tax=Dawidia cretensis TaxID=2782350 RepID=A0AAP2E4Y4_9BACT|nr:hypothetical protein [Dawidia cretensis]MBT1711932.1 hypothetical protein [Dawidia cretensis]
MEHAIEEPGKHLAALQKFIAVEVPVILKESPSADTLATVIDERFYQVRQEIYKGHLAHADAHAHTRYLALRQLTVLELVGHLLEHTQPIQLYSTLSHRTLTDDICRHLYRSLESLLNYTVEILANGQIDPGLFLPPAACMLYQQMLGGDLVALRDRFAALHVSPRLIDIVLEPFEELRHKDYITFYHAVYLRALKKELQALAGGKQQSTGDGDVLRLLVAHNFNEPAFVTYCLEVMEGQLETCTSPEARLLRLREYKSRLVLSFSSTRLAWHPDPHQHSVRQQIMESLDALIAATAPVLPINNAVSALQRSSDAEDYDIPDGMSVANALTHYMHPAVFGAIANAAHELRVIHLGDNDKQRAERISQIPSPSKRVSAETILRAFNEEKACRKALHYVEKLGSHLKVQIKKYEEKSSV